VGDVGFELARHTSQLILFLQKTGLAGRTLLIDPLGDESLLPDLRRLGGFRCNGAVRLLGLELFF
jgi:hypothetical protein